MIYKKAVIVMTVIYCSVNMIFNIHFCFKIVEFGRKLSIGTFSPNNFFSSNLKPLISNISTSVKGRVEIWQISRLTSTK